MRAGGRILLPAPLREFASLDKREWCWWGKAINLKSGMNRPGAIGGMPTGPAPETKKAIHCLIWTHWRSEHDRHSFTGIADGNAAGVEPSSERHLVDGTFKPGGHTAAILGRG